MPWSVMAGHTDLVEMSEIYSPTSWRLFDQLDVDLDPSGPEELFEVAARYVAGGRVLDVGCRDARYLIRLAQQFGFSGVGVDPVPWHIDRARTAIGEADLTGTLRAELGSIESYTSASGVFDLVWCRDVIEVLPDLNGAVARMSDVLAPDGVLIAYTNVLNGPPDPRETAAIHEPLGNVVDNLIEDDLEATWRRHHLTISEKVIVGTRWREYLEKRDHLVSRDLLRLARLRRQREHIIAEYGEAIYKLTEASTQWATNQFLGRFVPVIYVLHKG